MYAKCTPDVLLTPTHFTLVPLHNTFVCYIHVENTNSVLVLFSPWYYYSLSKAKLEMSLRSWQKVFTEKDLGDCTKHVKEPDVARWKEGGLTLADLPEMLDMVLEDADTRQQFALGNMMLGAKLNKAAVKGQPEVKHEPVIGLGQQEAVQGAVPAKRHYGDFPFKGAHWRLRPAQYFFTGQTEYMASGICLPCDDKDVVDKRGESKTFDYVTNFQAPTSKMYKNVHFHTFSYIFLCRLSCFPLRMHRAQERH